MFVLPCKIARSGDMDGIPVTLMEAMAMKLPVISTTVSGIPELIENGSSGILVPPNDFKKLAEAIIFLVRNQEIREKIGQTGRKVIKDKLKTLDKELAEVWAKCDVCPLCGEEKK